MGRAPACVGKGLKYAGVATQLSMYKSLPNTSAVLPCRQERQESRGGKHDCVRKKA